jgi:excinuclease UvrABC helicase subunit UvrB
MKPKRNNPFEDFFNSLFEDSFFFGSLKLKNSFFDNDDSSFPKDGDVNFNKTEEIIDTETHSTKKEVWTSLDGKQSFQRTTIQSKKKENSLPSKDELKYLRDAAVAEHRYEDAAKYRDELLKLERSSK